MIKELDHSRVTSSALKTELNVAPPVSTHTASMNYVFDKKAGAERSTTGLSPYNESRA